MQKQYFPAGHRWRDEFPEARKILGAWGEAIFLAEKDGVPYLIADSGTLADMLGPEDQDVIDQAVKIIRFDSTEEREAHLRESGFVRVYGDKHAKLFGDYYAKCPKCGSEDCMVYVYTPVQEDDSEPAETRALRQFITARHDGAWQCRACGHEFAKKLNR